MSDTRPLTIRTSVLYTVFHVGRQAPGQGPTPDTGQSKIGSSEVRVHVAPRRNTTVKTSRNHMHLRLAPEDGLLIVMAGTGTAGVSTAPRGSQVPSLLAGEG